MYYTEVHAEVFVLWEGVEINREILGDKIEKINGIFYFSGNFRHVSFQFF